MLNNARSLLSYGKISNMKQIQDKIQGISMESYSQEVAQKIFNPDHFSMLIYQ